MLFELFREGVHKKANKLKMPSIILNVIISHYLYLDPYKRVKEG